MTARPLTSADLDWFVDLLERRRAALRPFAPVFWRPAPRRREHHLDFLGQLLGAGAEGYRTETSGLLASPRRGAGWLVDDAHVPGERWSDGDGAHLWRALAEHHPGESVRFVCPAYERERNDFAAALGLNRVSSWWLAELEDPRPGRPGEVAVPGVEHATLVPAPPVYAPGGPVLLVRGTPDPVAAVPLVLEFARTRGCAALVVETAPGDASVAQACRDHGLREQCHFYEGLLTP